MSDSKNETTQATDEQKKIEPIFFVEQEDLVTVDIDVVFSNTNGKVFRAVRSGVLERAGFSIDGYTIKKFSFTFKRPSFEEISRFTSRSMEYNINARKMMIDQFRFRNFVIAWLLKEWTVTDKNGQIIELKHDPNGCLSEESIIHTRNISFDVMDAALLCFEQDVGLLKE